MTVNARKEVWQILLTLLMLVSATVRCAGEGPNAGRSVRTVRKFEITSFGKPRRVRHVTFNPKGTRLAACTDDLRVRIWDVEKGKLLVNLHDETSTIDFDPSGKMLVSGLSGYVKLRDAETGQRQRLFELNSAIAGIPLRVQFSPDGKLIAAQDSHRGVRIYDVKTGATRFHLKVQTTKLFRFHPRKKQLAVVMSSSGANWVSLFDTKTGKKSQKEFNQNLLIWPADLDFSPDGKRLAFCGDFGPKRTGLCVVFDTASGRILQKLKGHPRRILCVRFSADGKRLATGSADGSIVLWKTADGSQLEILRGHKGPVNTVAFHPKCTLLASGSADGSIRLWDIASKRKRIRHRTKTATSRFQPHITYLSPHSGRLFFSRATYDGDSKRPRFHVAGMRGSERRWAAVQAASMGWLGAFPTDRRDQP